MATRLALMVGDLSPNIYYYNYCLTVTLVRIIMNEIILRNHQGDYL